MNSITEAIKLITMAIIMLHSQNWLVAYKHVECVCDIRMQLSQCIRSTNNQNLVSSEDGIQQRLVAVKGCRPLRLRI